MLVILSTVPSIKEGEDLAQRIVSLRLAACVQILPKMTSVYFWDGVVQRDEEHLLLIKTAAEKFDELEDFIRQNHTYDTPEIVAIEAARVSLKYRHWLHAYLAD